MTELILVRHGQTYANDLGLYCGCMDSDLNPLGIEEAENLRDILSKEKIDVIYSSDLTRCAVTAEIINHYHKVDLILKEGLREMNFGLWQDMSSREVSLKYPQEFKKWGEDWLDYRVPEGESSREAYKRVVNTIKEIILLNKEKKILVVTHSGCIRSILAFYIGEKIETYWHFKVSFGTVTRMEIVDDYAILTALNSEK